MGPLFLAKLDALDLEGAVFKLTFSTPMHGETVRTHLLIPRATQHDTMRRTLQALAASRDGGAFVACTDILAAWRSPDGLGTVGRDVGMVDGSGRLIGRDGEPFGKPVVDPRTGRDLKRRGRKPWRPAKRKGAS